jgi:type I restriction enzyme M protein
MDQSQLNWLTNFIWSIADDVLHDLFKRGKYPDVIFPMCVIRRMNAIRLMMNLVILPIEKDIKSVTDVHEFHVDAGGYGRIRHAA